jgi:hypothetical protein
VRFHLVSLVVGVVLMAGIAAAEAAGGPSATESCRPNPGLGSVALWRGRLLSTIDLSTCHRRVSRAPVSGRVSFGSDGRAGVLPSSPLLSADGRLGATVRVTGRRETTRYAIWVTDRRTGSRRSVFSEGGWGDTVNLSSPGPIVLLAWSGDDRWVFFATDPGGSGSIAADGLILQVVSSTGGSAHRLRVALPNPDYLTWCGGQVVFTAGDSRIATEHKRVVAAAPPNWRVHLLTHAPARAWGSLTCSPDGRSVVVQSQAVSHSGSFFAAHWALWRIGFDGSQSRLTAPSPGYTDESPRYSRDGTTLMFVRTHHGRGTLYALRNGTIIGPLLSLGYSFGFYGHRDWWQTMAWSLARPGSS